MFNSNTALIRFYSYRTAAVAPIVKFTASKFDKFCLKKFLEANGFRMDNHICMVLCFENAPANNRTELNVMYTDGFFYIGELIEGKW